MGNMMKNVIPNNALRCMWSTFNMKKAAALSFQNDLLTDSTWPSQVVVTIENNALSAMEHSARPHGKQVKGERAEHNGRIKGNSAL